MPAIDIGIDEAARKDIANELTGVLADTFALYVMTHGFHWNVTGPWFDTLHAKFQVQYNELWLALDDLAERIRTLGELAPASMAGFQAKAQITAVDGPVPAKEMVARLVKGHEHLAKRIRPVLTRAQQAGDESTAALLSDRLSVHEKTAWMLRALLEG